MSNRKIHVLNSTAGFVLVRCDGTQSATEIARRLVDATGADATTVERDVDAIIADFERLELLARSRER